MAGGHLLERAAGRFRAIASGHRSASEQKPELFLRQREFQAIEPIGMLADERPEDRLGPPAGRQRLGKALPPRTRQR